MDLVVAARQPVVAQQRDLVLLQHLAGTWASVPDVVRRTMLVECLAAWVDERWTLTLSPVLCA